MFRKSYNSDDNLNKKILTHKRQNKSAKLHIFTFKSFKGGSNIQWYFRDELKTPAYEVLMYDTINSLFYGRCASLVFWKHRVADDHLYLTFMFAKK